MSENKNASAAEDAAPISVAEAERLFHPLSQIPVLLLAVSGGPDSTALLLLAARWRQTLATPPKLVAVTIDHGLRAEAKNEARDVARLARSLHIEHRTLRWTGPKPKTGLQAGARKARYRLLAEAARKVGATHVLTAHTLDDQAETVLMRLAGGSGVSGLAGMGHFAPMPVPEGEGITLVRPLLGVAKARLIATLKAAKVRYAVDPTNHDPRFTRSRLRASMPVLAREGLTAERLALLARRVERVEFALRDTLNEALARLAPGPWPEKGPVCVDVGAFSALPGEIGQRLLGRVIDGTGNEGPVELGKLEALYGALTDAIGAGRGAKGRAGHFRRTLAGAVITLKSDKLLVERAPRRRPRASKRP